MKIGIIGAGYVSRALTQAAIKHGHEVMISNSRDPRTLSTAKMMLQCQTGTAEQAGTFGEIVIVAVPLSSYQAIPVQPLAGKIVIDTDNYYPDRDGAIPELDRGETTTSELLAKHLPESKIVKAFNAIIIDQVNSDGKPAGTPDRRALPLCGDDAAAKQVVAGLYDQFGFDTVDAGPLAEGRRFERDTPAYCIPMDRDKLTATLAETR